MKFYHATSLQCWEEISKEGILWGRRFYEGKEISRCTYLAVEKEDAKHYGEVILEVEYEPNPADDNYIEGCWQLRVYCPIPLDKVKKI